jgi:hypothetical protein
LLVVITLCKALGNDTWKKRLELRKCARNRKAGVKRRREKRSRCPTESQQVKLVPSFGKEVATSGFLATKSSDFYFLDFSKQPLLLRNWPRFRLAAIRGRLERRLDREPHLEREGRSMSPYLSPQVSSWVENSRTVIQEMNIICVKRQRNVCTFPNSERKPSLQQACPVPFRCTKSSFPMKKPAKRARDYCM